MEESRFEQLRAAYDASFERLRLEFQALELAELHDDETCTSEQRRRVHDAEVLYRIRRDELTQFMLAQQGQEVEEAAHA